MSLLSLWRYNSLDMKTGRTGLLIVVLAAIVLAVAVPFTWHYIGERSMESQHIRLAEIASVTFASIEHNDALRADLRARGLLEQDEEDALGRGMLDVGGIDRLIRRGVYEIDGQQLIFGPQYSPP